MKFRLYAIQAATILLLLSLSFLRPASADSPAPIPAANAAPLIPGLRLPPPTDQPPPEVPLPDPLPLGHGFLVNGALDLRTRTADMGRSNSVWANILELDLQHSIVTQGETRGNIVVQLLGEDPPDIPHAQDVQVGDAYVLYKLPLVNDTDTTAYVKFGQFQIPFGLLAVYDPHLLIIQPLYAESLGLRTDFGIAFSGRAYGYLNYDFAITTGSGPNHASVDPKSVVTFRLGRTFATRNGVVNVGGSLLQGRLPVTDIDAQNPYAVELPPSGRLRPYRGLGFVTKSRIGGDASYGYKNATARGEAVFGADNDKRVLGYYAEANYRFSGRVGAALARSYYLYPVGNSSASRDSVGLTYAAGANLTLRAVYQNLRDVPSNQSSRNRHRFTVQLLLRF